MKMWERLQTLLMVSAHLRSLTWAKSGITSCDFQAVQVKNLVKSTYHLLNCTAVWWLSSTEVTVNRMQELMSVNFAETWATSSWSFSLLGKQWALFSSTWTSFSTRTLSIISMDRFTPQRHLDMIQNSIPKFFTFGSLIGIQKKALAMQSVLPAVPSLLTPFLTCSRATTNKKLHL